MRYLIVDDDAACRQLLGALLSPYADCNFAENGTEAVEAVRKAANDGSPYDLVCLDIMMPTCDGHEALKTIRREERERGLNPAQGVKVIMTTALSDPLNLVHSVQEGCQSYINKPIDEEELFAEMRAMRVLHASTQASAPPRESDSAAVAQEGPKHDGGSAIGSRRFLVVEDDLLCRELLKQILSQYGRCDEAKDGDEAIDAIHLSLEDGLPYDLVCLDIMMPGQDGHDVLEAIRHLEDEYGIWCSSGVKVIMTTALCDSKHCVRAFREGCESYLTKPINAEKLFEVMKSLGLLTEQPA